MLPIDTNKVCGTKNCIQVYNGQMRQAISIGIRSYDPHACVFIGSVAHAGEPLDEGARIKFTPEFERKEKSNPSNVKPTHSLGIWICLKEYTVMTARATPPRGYGTDSLTTHATSATDIARSIKGRYS